MGLTILEVCALRKLIDVKKPCSDICNKLTLEYSQGQRNHPVAYLAQVLWVLKHPQYWDHLLLSPPFSTRSSNVLNTTSFFVSYSELPK
jgi:hypothetical protein